MIDTKNTICNAFLDLTKEKKPEKITVIDICKKAYVSRETFYYYFKDKYDLFEWVYKENLTKRIKSHSSEVDWIIMIKNAIIDALEYRDLFYKTIGNQNLEFNEIVFETLYSVYCEEISHCIDDGNLSKQLKAQIYIYLKGGIYYYQYYLKTYENASYSEIAELIAGASPESLIRLWKTYKEKNTL